ncbi:MAG: hypothetical protein V4510_13045 [bacterium]
MSVTVSIGRNVEGEPMSNSDWVVFKRDLRHVFARLDLAVYFQGAGIGYSDEWGTEEAYTVVAESNVAKEALLNSLLYAVRYLYGQEAVAVTIGPTRFV